MKDVFLKYPMLVVAAFFALGIVAGVEVFPTLAWPFAAWAAVGCVVAAVLGFKGKGSLSHSVFLLMSVFALGFLRIATSDDVQAYSYQTKKENPVRKAIIARMNQVFDEQEATTEGGVVVAMTMGDKRDINRDLRADYSESGAAHVLALSGMHIGIVFFLLRLLRRRPSGPIFSWDFLLVEALIIAAIWVYVYLVGMPPSAVRAATMVSLYELMSLQYRQRISLNAIGATAFVMLLIHPLDLYQISFQLSFSAVIGIVVMFPMLYSLLPKPKNRIVVWLWSSVCVSLAAQIFVTPLIAYHFNYISAHAVWTSLVVIPCATIIVSLSMLLLVFLKLTPIASIIVVPLKWVAHAMNTSVAWFAALPGATISPVHLNRTQVLTLYLAIFCTCLLLARITKKNKLIS